MTSKQTMMAPPRASAVRPAAFLQTYATAKPALRGVPIIPRSVFLQSKTQRHNVPGSSVAELRAAFTDLDVDGDGFVTRSELARACVALGLPGGDDYVSELMSQCDEDGDGAVSFADYSAYARRNEKSFRRAWDDITASMPSTSPPPGMAGARITAEETLTAVRALGIESADRSDAERMVSLLDRDGCGGVSFADFRRYVALLPMAQVRSNATWNWLSATTTAAEAGLLSSSYEYSPSSSTSSGASTSAAATGDERSQRRRRGGRRGARPLGAEHDKPSSQPAKQLFAGGLAGIIAKTTVAPLDRARTMIQDVGCGGVGARRRTVTAVFGKVLREEGPLGLFRGNMVSALKVVPANALQFAIFHNMKDAIRRGKGAAAAAATAGGEERNGVAEVESAGGQRRRCTKQSADLTVAERLASGAAAGAVSTAVCYPLDVLKSQMSVSGGLKGSVLAAARQLFVEQGGARAFYKGLGPTLVADVIGTGLGFTLYDTFNSLYRTFNGGRKPTPAAKGVLGGFSACLCMTATQPLEVVMTRMRVQGVGGRPVLYKNAVDCIRLLVRREGVRSLWLGTGAGYVKVFPQLAVTYYIFELVSEKLGVGGLERYDNGDGAAAASSGASGGEKVSTAAAAAVA